MQHTDDASGQAVLERGARMSRSMIWRLQRAFFAREGVDAWRKGTVPHYVTSNPFIAEAYARVVMGFLRDCEALVDPSQPIHVIELGAGSGRFAHHLLDALLPLLRRRGAPAVRVKYVMTDFADATIAFWRSHRSLAPLVEAGVLDFARFDAERDHALTLLASGEQIREGALRNPVVVLANYFFDGLPQDAFLVADGELHEAEVTVTSPQPEPDLDDPAILGRVRLTHTYRAIVGDAFADDDLDSILRGYRDRLGRTVIRFPTSALACCKALFRISGRRLLLLSADKGTLREEELAGRAPPELVVHGSFSLDVDYHAIGELFRRHGGEALHPRHRAGSLAVVAFLLGRAPGEHPETEDAFTDAVAAFGPDDFFVLKKGIEPFFAQMSLAQLVAVLRLARCDTRVASQALPTLIQRAAGASPREREDLLAIADLVWRSYYHLGEPEDLAFQLCVLALELGAHEDALRYCDESVRLYGPDAHTSYNRALALRALRRLDEALTAVEETLRTSPAHDGALALRAELSGSAPSSAEPG